MEFFLIDGVTEGFQGLAAMRYKKGFQGLTMAWINKPSSDPHQPGNTRQQQTPFPQEKNRGIFWGKRWVGHGCMGVREHAGQDGRERAIDATGRTTLESAEATARKRSEKTCPAGRPAARAIPLTPILKLGGKKLLIHGGRALFPNRGVYLFLRRHA
jgi:hypothetical protein